MSLKLGMDHCLPLEPIQSGENPFISTNFTSTNCFEAEFDNLKAELPVINNFITNEYVQI
jgi:hypothetical protein